MSDDNGVMSVFRDLWSDYGE